MFSFLKNRPTKVYRVRVANAIQARNVDGEVRPYAIGEELECGEADHAEIVSNGDGVSLGVVGADGVATLPPKEKPTYFEKEFVRATMPANYKDLPHWFTDAWDEAEKRRELAVAVSNAEERLRSVGAAGVFGNEAHAGATIVHEKVLRAREALQRFDTLKLERALFECGKCVVSEIRSANGLRDAVAEIACETFSARLAALGLHESHLRRLFLGSALQQKYVVQPIAETELRSAGDFQYWDAALGSMASAIFYAREKAAARREKLTAVKAEREAAINPQSEPAKKSRFSLASV